MNGLIIISILVFVGLMTFAIRRMSGHKPDDRIEADDDDNNY